MRVLVTGVSGFSGSYVARALAHAGFDVVGTYRRETPFLLGLSGNARHLQLVRTNLLDAQALSGPFEIVVHAAAASPAPGITTANMVRDNVDATLALLDATAGWRCRAFVLFSSLSIYGEITAPVLDEACPIVNPDGYGTTKRVCELLLADRADRLPGLALRLPGVVGPGAHRNWLSGVAAALLTGQPVRAFHLDGQFNNAAHIADIAAMVRTIVQRPWQGFDAVVLGARSTLTVRSAINRLAHGLSTTAHIEPIEAPKAAFILSSHHAIERWGYDPMSIGDMIDRYAFESREIHANAEAFDNRMSHDASESFSLRSHESS
jgi:nucleoside-diphosphate-sugar epimerase